MPCPITASSCDGVVRAGRALGLVLALAGCAGDGPEGADGPTSGGDGAVSLVGTWHQVVQHADGDLERRTLVFCPGGFVDYYRPDYHTRGGQHALNDLQLAYLRWERLDDRVRIWLDDWGGGRPVELTLAGTLLDPVLPGGRLAPMSSPRERLPYVRASDDDVFEPERVPRVVVAPLPEEPEGDSGRCRPIPVTGVPYRPTGPWTAEPRITGSRPRAQVDEAISRVDFSTCYAEHPDVSGTVLVSFGVTAGGRVFAPKVARPTEDLADAEACVADRLRKVSLPRAEGTFGQQHVFGYPIAIR